MSDSSPTEAIIVELTASILLCTYGGDDPNQLVSCLESLISQSRPADEVILDCDGPLPGELEAVVSKYDKTNSVLKTVRCKQNRGLIAALNEGLKHCSCDLALRVDSDDLAHEDRIRIQASYLEQHSEIGVVGTSMLEFESVDISMSRLKPAPHTQLTPRNNCIYL